MAIGDTLRSVCSESIRAGSMAYDDKHITCDRAKDGRRMLTQLRHRAVYATFDLFPAVKGAAVHIQHMADTLFTAWDGGLLYVLGNEHLPQYQREGNVEIVR